MSPKPEPDSHAATLGCRPALPEHVGGRPWGRSAPGSAHPYEIGQCIWPIAPVVFVQRAEQLVSLGEPPEGSPIHTYHSFSTEQIYRTFTARLPTASPPGTKRKLMGDAQNCAETALNCAESDLGPDFIGTLVPNFGFGNRSVHDGCDRQKEPNVFLVQVPATEDNDNSWLSAPHGTKINSLIHRCRPSALRTRPHHSCRSFTPPIELGQLWTRWPSPPGSEDRLLGDLCRHAATAHRR